MGCGWGGVGAVLSGGGVGWSGMGRGEIGLGGVVMGYWGAMRSVNGLENVPYLLDDSIGIYSIGIYPCIL